MIVLTINVIIMSPPKLRGKTIGSNQYNPSVITIQMMIKGKIILTLSPTKIMFQMLFLSFSLHQNRIQKRYQYLHYMIDYH